MDADTWTEIQELFLAIADLPAEAQAEALRESGASTAVQEAVAALLAADAEPDPVFDRTPHMLVAGLTGGASTASGSAGGDPSPPPGLEPGARIGPYTLGERLGEGGMGLVLGGVHSEFGQRVAIKVVKRGMDTDEIVRRFEAERRILAQLEHPNIARLLDGGVTLDGRPWFSMEYVDGEPIDRYCDRLELSVAERVALVRRACEAVQHAHAALVVHRDLKPSNILVTADGTVKLLDFGIAKLLGADETEAPLGPTRVGTRPMSPGYAAPEQVLGQPVTMATDIYALGVVLYRLIAGRSPYGEGLTSTELEKAIVEVTPPPPGRVSAARGGRATELDSVVLMALRKEPARRYESVRALADDLDRFLTGYPVRASGDSVVYRSRKFVGRNRLALGAAAAVLVGVLGTAGAYTVQLREERDRATLEARKAAEVSDFLEGLFETADPTESQGRQVTAVELLRAGSERVETELAGQPEVQATMFATIGRVYAAMGLFDEAEGPTNRALELRRGLGGADPDDVAGDAEVADDADVAESLVAVGVLRRQMGGLDEAETRLAEAVEMYRRLAESDSDPSAEGEPLAEALVQLGSVAQERGDVVGADTLFLRALEIRRALHEGDAPEVAASLQAAGAGRYIGNDFLAADSLFTQAYEMRARLHGERDSRAAQALHDVAITRLMMGRHEEAEGLMREVVDVRGSVLGDRHPGYAHSLMGLGSTLQFQGRIEEAAAVYEEVLEIFDEVYPGPHQDQASIRGRLARTYGLLGRHADAVRRARESVDIGLEVYGEVVIPMLSDYSILGNALANLGRFDEAEEVAALERRERERLQPDGWDHTVNLQNVASYRRDAGAGA